MSKHDDDMSYLFEHEMSRRDFMLDLLAKGGLAATMATLPGLLNAAEPPDDEVVRIGYIPITDATALLVAHAKGYFEEEGLKVEKPTLIRGWSPLVEGFAAGKFNLVHLLKPIPVWMRYNNDFPVKIMSWAHLNGSAVVVGKHVDAKDFGDLGGKQVAVPYLVLMHNIVLQMGLRNAGLIPVIKDQTAELAPNEVNLMIMPPPDMPPALASKKIDAYIVAEPFNAVGELMAGGTHAALYRRHLEEPPLLRGLHERRHRRRQAGMDAEGHERRGRGADLRPGRTRARSRRCCRRTARAICRCRPTWWSGR